MTGGVALGALIGIALGALGGGGSMLAFPVLVHLDGRSAPVATATALVAVAVAAAVASVGHGRAGRVRWRPAAAFVLLGVPGSWLGSRLNERLDEDVLLLAFSVLVLAAARRMLAMPAVPAAVVLPSDGMGSWPPPGRVGDAGSAHPASLRIGVAACGVGALTGLFGVGGGFVIVPALTLGVGLAMPIAVGTSLVVIVGNTVVALAVRGLDTVEWSLAAPFATTMLLGSVAGVALSQRVSSARSQQAFGLLLVVVALGNGGVAVAGLVA